MFIVGQVRLEPFLQGAIGESAIRKSGEQDSLEQGCFFGADRMQRAIRSLVFFDAPADRVPAVGVAGEGIPTLQAPVNSASLAARLTSTRRNQSANPKRIGSTAMQRTPFRTHIRRTLKHLHY